MCLFLSLIPLKFEKDSNSNYTNYSEYYNKYNNKYNVYYVDITILL